MRLRRTAYRAGGAAAATLERIPLTRNRSRVCLWPLRRRAGFPHGSA